MTVYIALFISALLIGVDQLIKVWAVNTLSAVGSMPVIPHLLDFTYVENYGAAYGIMTGKTVLLIAITAFVLGLLIKVLLSKKIKHRLAIASLSLIIAGGLGNLIDRIAKGFVVDYLDINPLFSFPVFNFADCCVVIGTGLLIVYILFFEPKEAKAAKEAAEQEQTKHTETND